VRIIGIKILNINQKRIEKRMNHFARLSVLNARKVARSFVIKKRSRHANTIIVLAICPRSFSK
jgi:hypothetical protein